MNKVMTLKDFMNFDAYLSAKEENGLSCKRLWKIDSRNRRVKNLGRYIYIKIGHLLIL